MFYAYLCCKLYPMKSAARNSTVCFGLPHKLLSGPILPRVFRDQFSHNFASLIEEAAAVSPSDGNSNTFTVSYLVNSCGLSPKRALLASKLVNFETPEKPNAVLAFLRYQGFCYTHIGRLVRLRPQILLYSNPQEDLFPKIEFFRSIWVSRTELASILSRYPLILTGSLENRIVPLSKFLTSIFQTDKAIASGRMWAECLRYKDPETRLVPNISLLRELGVPESCIILLLACQRRALMLNNVQFTQGVSEVKAMGFDMLKSSIVLALCARLWDGHKLRWARSHKVYSSWGWSEDDICRAFRIQPSCMLLSEKKITRTMDFLVNKMGVDSRIIMKYPVVLCLSLEKRIIPRGSVVHLLSLKGLIKKNISLSSIFCCVEKYFLGRFVTAYEGQVPQLHHVYQGKVKVFDV